MPSAITFSDQMPGMTIAAPQILQGNGPGETRTLRRWLGCLILIASLHAAALMAAVHGGVISPLPHPPAAVMTIELAPLDKPPPAAEDAAKTKPKAEPRKPAAKIAKPRQQTPLPPTPAPAQMASASLPPPPQQLADTAPAEPVPEAPIRRVQSQAVPNWQGALLAHLEQHKRYPRNARMRRDEGVTVIRFVMDRGGQVLTSKLERSSGTDSLDEEGLALLDRAQPLPAPPDEVEGERIELVVPVQFRLR